MRVSKAVFAVSITVMSLLAVGCDNNNTPNPNPSASATSQSSPSPSPSPSPTPSATPLASAISNLEIVNNSNVDSTAYVTSGSTLYYSNGSQLVAVASAPDGSDDLAHENHQ